MELVVAAETETGQLGSDGPGPPTEVPTTERMAKTGLRKPQAVFATVTSQRSPAFIPGTAALYRTWGKG